MQRTSEYRKSRYREDFAKRRVIRRPDSHEYSPTHNLPDNLARAKQLLEESLGSEWVSDDVAVACGYARDQSFVPATYPHIVCLPASTEEVAEVYHIANECMVDVMPFGTGISTVGATIPMFGGIECDLRRMDRIIDIDERNMYARIQPGVNFCELQAEAQLRGLRLTNPSTSATAGVISNHASCNISSLACKYGFGMDNVIDVLMVLPTGEVFEAGPRSCGMIPAHLPGPGPDMTNLFRYSAGTQGIVTELTVRLYPEPDFEGRSYPIYSEDNMADIIEALYQVARDNMAIELMQTQNTFFGAFMVDTNRDAESVVPVMPRNIIMAVFGGASEEEARLKAELTKRLVAGVSDKFEFMDPDSLTATMDEAGMHPDRSLKFMRETVRVQRVKGGFLIGALMDRIDNLALVEEAMRIVTTRQAGTNSDVMRPDEPGLYFQPYHMGRVAYLEFDLYTDQSDPDDIINMLITYFRAMSTGMSEGAIFAAGAAPLVKGLPMTDMVMPMVYPGFSLYMETLTQLKKAIDPNNISNRRWDYETETMPKLMLF